MVRDNIDTDGSLNGDKFCRALLIHRNNPDPATGVSPAQILFGRQLRDHLPTPVHKFALRSEWQKAAKLREECFLRRHYAKCEDLNSKAKNLETLAPGDSVYVQNQTGNNPCKWGKSGKVLEVLPHDSFLISIDGSHNVTKRNRKFLRKFTPMNFSLEAEKSSQPSQTSVPVPPVQTDPEQHGQTSHGVEEFSPMSTPPVSEQFSPQVTNHNEGNQYPEAPNAASQQPTVTQSCDTPADQDAQPSVGQPQRRQLPPHLRERWVFDPNYHPQKQTTSNQSHVAPIVDWNMNRFGAQPYQQVNPYYSTSTNYSNPQSFYPGMYTQPPLQIDREQSVRNAASSFMQACLEALNLNLSAANI